MKALALALCLITSQKFAHIVSVKGEVKVIRAGAGPVVRAEKGLTLFPGDVVETGSDGRVEIEYPDGSKVVIYENSRLVLEKKTVAEGSVISKVFTFLKLSIGKIKAVIKKRDKTASVGVVSPSAVVGIRGTDFTVGVAADGSTVVEVEEGVVELNAGEVKVEEGYRAIYDVEEGLKLERADIPFLWEEWMRKKREAFEKKQREIHKMLNQIMLERLKRYQKFVGALEEEGDERKAEDILSTAFFLKESISTAIDEYGKKGLRLKTIEERFREVNARYERIVRGVEERFRKRRERIEERFRRKMERIEKRFKKFEE